MTKEEEKDSWECVLYKKDKKYGTVKNSYRVTLSEEELKELAHLGFIRTIPNKNI